MPQATSVPVSDLVHLDDNAQECKVMWYCCRRTTV